MAVKADCTAPPSRWFLQSGQSEWRVGTDEALLDCLSAPYAQSATVSGATGEMGVPNDGKYGEWKEREGRANVSCHRLAQIVGQLLLGVFHLYTFYPLYHIR